MTVYRNKEENRLKVMTGTRDSRDLVAHWQEADQDDGHEALAIVRTEGNLPEGYRVIDEGVADMRAADGRSLGSRVNCKSVMRQMNTAKFASLSVEEWGKRLEEVLA